VLAGAKFGLERDEALAAYRDAAANESLEPVGLSFHVGSQLIDTSPILVAAERAAELWRELVADGIRLRDLDVGGGLAVPYDGSAAPDLDAYAAATAEIARSLDATLVLEPGRHLVAPVGTFVTRVIRVKKAGGTTIAVCDGASTT